MNKNVICPKVWCTCFSLFIFWDILSATRSTRETGNTTRQLKSDLGSWTQVIMVSSAYGPSSTKLMHKGSPLTPIIRHLFTNRQDLNCLCLSREQERRRKKCVERTKQMICSHLDKVSIWQRRQTIIQITLNLRTRIKGRS